MKKINALFALILFLGTSACVTQKRSDEPSFLKKFYHNTTAEFNGYFNADVIMQETKEAMNLSYQDNYNKVLPVYPYVASKDYKAIAPEMDRAIEKVSVVVSLHRISDWTDDCYLLMGQAQYMKKDYESAEETLEYSVSEFNPETMERRKAKYAKEYAKNARAKKAAKKKEVKEKEKEREQIRKEKKKEMKRKRKLKEKERKRKNKEIRKRRKARRKGKKYKRSSKKEDEQQPPTPEPTPAPSTPKEEEKPEPPKEEDPQPELAKEKPFKREPAYQDIQLWLARTYVEREKYSQAGYIFEELNNSSNTYKPVRAALGPAMAHFYIKQKKFDQAIPHLENAIELTKDRQSRARYAYILAQLYQRQKNTSNTLAYFKKAKKWSNDYEMAFNAQLSTALNKYRSGATSIEGTISRLERFLKDSKNDDYQDQIYFALGKVALENNQPNLAITYFEKSIELNTGNLVQKAETYIALADLYHDQDRFVEAKKYYDEALEIVPESDENYARMERLSKNLDEIAENMSVIILQDSLLRIAEMDKKELRTLAQKLKDEKKAADADQGASKSYDKRGRGARAATQQSITLSNTRGRTAPSTFPFYNEKSSKKGEKDFKQIWGNRKLTDDWRRSNKQGFADIDIEVEEEEELNLPISDSEIDLLFKDVPKTEEDKKAAHKLIEDAMLELGRLYRERIQRDDKTIDILESRLLVEYPKTRHELEAWYNLYISHTNLGNTAQATEYKNKIIKKYPTDMYAKVLSDPNYAMQLLEEQQRISDYYDAAFEEYSKGNYKDAYDRSMRVEELFEKDNPFMSKFALLSAICTGKVQGKDQYILAIKDVIGKYPNTPEATRAKEILRLLEGRATTVSSGASAEGEEEAAKKFVVEHDKLHYVLVVITDKGDIKVNEAKSSIASFNRDYYSLEKLRISNIYLGTNVDRPIMVIRKYNDKEEAMEYYQKAMEKKTEFIPEGMTFEVYPITQNNYRQILKDKSLTGYATFFEENYLND